jgi:hypothetical protein
MFIEELKNVALNEFFFFFAAKNETSNVSFVPSSRLNRWTTCTGQSKQRTINTKEKKLKTENE